MRIKSPWLIRLITWCLAKTLRTIARTCKYQVFLEQPGTNPADPDCPEHYIYAVWHDAVLPPVSTRTFIKRWTDGNRIAALVSQHADGSYLVEFMKNFRIDAVRGSSTRGGAQALKRLQESLAHSHVWITPDGPRGPRREVKPGIVYLASQTGLPIVINVSAMTRYWDIQGSWTNQTVPKPFSTIYCLLSKPITVPPEITREQLREYQRLLESEFARMESLAQQLAAGEITELPPTLNREVFPKAA